MPKRGSVSSTTFLILESFIATTLVAAASYHVIKRIPILGSGGWDYITADSQARRLYIPHSSEVVVLNLDSAKIIGQVTGLEDAHGVAVAREFNRGFISASDPGSISIFDLNTLAVIKKVRVGDDPNGIIYDSKTKRIFSADRGSQRLTAIDAKTGEVVGAVNNLDGRTEHLAADETGHVFLNMQNRNRMYKIDVSAMKIIDTWSTDPCGQPSSMDMDRAHDRVFVGCRSGLMAVFDGETGKIVFSAPIGMGVDATEFDPDKKLVFFSTGGGDGAVSIFHQDSPDKYTLNQKVKTLPGARTLAVDHKTEDIYLPIADLGPAPAPTSENPRPRPPIIPGTFSVLVVRR